jgi:trimethylamine:corrinoid methyltransferase-like protein
MFSKFNLHLKDGYYQGELILSDVETEESETYIFDILKATVKGANEAQNSGATLTYAKRYSLMNAFNIAENNADFDSDAMAKKQEAGEQAEKQAEILSELSIRVSEFSTADEFKEKGASIREEFMSKGLSKQQVDSIMAKAFKRLK